MELSDEDLEKVAGGTEIWGATVLATMVTAGVAATAYGTAKQGW